MTGRKSDLREYRDLKDGGKVKFDKNATGEIKGDNYKWRFYNSKGILC